MELVSFAHDILDLVEENRMLRAKVHELEAFKQAYWNEVEASRKHGEAMMVGLLDLCLVPGVMNAIEDARA